METGICRDMTCPLRTEYGFCKVTACTKPISKYRIESPYHEGEDMSILDMLSINNYDEIDKTENDILIELSDLICTGSLSNYYDLYQYMKTYEPTYLYLIIENVSYFKALMESPKPEKK